MTLNRISLAIAAVVLSIVTISPAWAKKQASGKRVRVWSSSKTRNWPPFMLTRVLI